MIVLGAAAAVLAPSGPATAAGPTNRYPVNPTGTVNLAVKGLGHGHGMSQYGALGAAERGLSAGRILPFYYPGTAAFDLGPTWIRVDLSGTGPALTVGASPGLRVRGVAEAQSLAVNGVAAYRLVADGPGVQLQRRLVGGAWQVLVGRVLPNGSAFQRPDGAPVRVLRADGTSIAYRENVRAVRYGAGVTAVNFTTLDHYVMGVVPREIPASWPTAAVTAQAIAARSYGRYAVIHAAPGASWDICDTSQCQVYGGATRRDSSGRITALDDADAVKYYANTVLRYAGSVAFTQFSASNGGWMAAGGEPYLVAKPDPYDTEAHDPDFSYGRSIAAATLARDVGLGYVTELDLTRDGQGQWGGRVVSATVRGPYRSVAVSGSDLAYYLGLGTTYFTVLG